MHAVIHTTYGAPDVLTVQERPAPALAPDQVLVRVIASPVTQGDRRMRAADFPGPLWLVGRLIAGLLRPRRPVPGTVYAGRIEAVGSAVTRWQVGQDVWGAVDAGAHAEYIAVPQDGALSAMPAGMSHVDAASLPYGGVTALYFLGELGRVQPGEHVAILGAGGGVGRYAVQVAHHLGARVTAVCRAEDFETVRALGAQACIDYREQDYAQAGPYDVILDTADASPWRQARAALTDRGRYLSLHLTVDLLGALLSGLWRRGPRAVFGLALTTPRHLEDLRVLAELGAVLPLVDRCYPLTGIVDAHARVDSGKADGTVVLTVSPAEPRVRLVG